MVPIFTPYIEIPELTRYDYDAVSYTHLALFLLGMLIGRKELFLKEHLKVWNKVLAGSLVAFFPLYGLGNMLPDFITNKSILTPLSLIITSLSNFAFMLILVSGCLLYTSGNRYDKRSIRRVRSGNIGFCFRRLIIH